VTAIGEKKAMRIGLAAFALQCIVLGFANRPSHLFLCVLFSMVANLVYPSLTSLVSSAVAPEMVGEALGAVNGIKALTEGVGPLVFGLLMTVSEHSALPGWPYFLAAVFAIAAYQRGGLLPDEDDEDYLSERYVQPGGMKKGNATHDSNGETGTGEEDNTHDNKAGFFSKFVSRIIPSGRNKSRRSKSALSEIELNRSSREDEYVGLLSQVERVDEVEFVRNNQRMASDAEIDGDESNYEEEDRLLT
jgi:hypothetical protein